uniref:Uncharacterized protein n=1 Tax=Felis catus TaxID=9685 RepID=A0ABI7Y673_FELCA
MIFGSPAGPRQVALAPRPGGGSPTPGDNPPYSRTGKGTGKRVPAEQHQTQHKHRHCWTRRLSTPASVQVILHCLHKGSKSLSH